METHQIYSKKERDEDSQEKETERANYILWLDTIPNLMGNTHIEEEVEESEEEKTLNEHILYFKVF